MLQWRFASNLMLNAQAKPWCFPFQVMTPGDNKWADALLRWEHITFRDVNSARFCSVDLKETSCSFFLRQQSRWLNKRDFFHGCILVSIKMGPYFSFESVLQLSVTVSIRMQAGKDHLGHGIQFLGHPASRNPRAAGHAYPSSTASLQPHSKTPKTSTKKKGKSKEKTKSDREFLQQSRPLQEHEILDKAPWWSQQAALAYRTEEDKLSWHVFFAGFSSKLL